MPLKLRMKPGEQVDVSGECTIINATDNRAIDLVLNGTAKIGRRYTPEETSETLKCKFCAARFRRWKTLPNGHKVDGFDSVRDHILLYHPEEADRMEITL